MRRIVLTLVIVLAAGLAGTMADAGNTTRRTGKQAIQDDSVYRQQTPQGQEIPKAYGGTRRNIPIGPNFIQGGQRPPPPPEPEEEPEESEEPETPPGEARYGCVSAPYDVRNDVPTADPKLRYTLGFERGFAGCLEKQFSLQNLAVAALAARFKEVAALLLVVAAPGVIDGVLHPPGISINPNPFARGKEEGERLCEWGMKVSPALVARCPAGRSGGSGAVGKTCTAAALSAYGNAAADAAANAGKRFDCFDCTMAWLKGEPYTPPANGGTPVTLDEIIPRSQSEYGENVPQGPELPCWRQSAQSKGIPGSMASSAIEAEMARAGDGAEGVVLILDPVAGDIGHVFGVKTIGNPPNARVEFWDPQQLMDGKLWFRPGAWTTFYRLR
jgi:hypothetical protein